MGEGVLGEGEWNGIEQPERRIAQEKEDGEEGGGWTSEREGRREEATGDIDTEGEARG
jgi:hypothetical protein